MPSLSVRLTNVVLRFLMKRSLDRLKDPLQLRQRMARLDALVRIPPDVGVSEQYADGVPALRLAVPGGDMRKIILYLHGGGFTSRSPNIHGRLLTRLCRRLGATGIMPHYRLAPEHPYPAATDDCLTAYRWLLSNGHDADDIVIMGDSAGGCLALVTAARALEEAVPVPACAVMMSPATDLTLSGESMIYNQFKDPVTTRIGCELVADHYLDGADPADPHASPLFGSFTGFPPLLFHAGSTEVLLDDSVRASKKAASAGVQTTCEIWEALPHVFQGLEFLPESRRAVRHIVQFVRRHTNWTQ